jgi:hypothetical protein
MAMFDQSSFFQAAAPLYQCAKSGDPMARPEGPCVQAKLRRRAAFPS